ncbi:MAG TPA: hypothetical protein VMU69_02800 [Bradyrhizobium sp.]|nr:hypothetical protein [Bradyrhizobium sp.]
MELDRDGRATADARTVLQTLHDTQSLHGQDRDRILRTVTRAISIFSKPTENFLTKTTDAKITVPRHLSKESAEFFRKTIEAYDLDDHHLLLLTKAMEAQDLAEKCREILDKEGLTYTDRFGAPRARPEAKILNDSRNALKNIFRELGFDLADDNNARPPHIAGRYK